MILKIKEVLWGLAFASMCSMLGLCLAVAVGVLSPTPKSGLAFFSLMLAFVVFIIMAAICRPAVEPEQG